MAKTNSYIFFIVVSFAQPVFAQFYSNYPTVDHPIHYLESYHEDIRVKADQTQAAFLLILLNLVSPIEGVRPEDMAPAEHIGTIGLQERLYTILTIDKKRFQLELIRREVGVENKTYETLPQELIELQRTFARRIAEEPTLEDITKLATISFTHPDPLIRIASAPLLIVLTDGEQEALEVLRSGMRLKDRRLSLLAATLLARFSVDDPALRQLAMEKLAGSDLKETLQTTIVIHGTWASNATWWKNGYPFFEYLEHEVPLNGLYIGNDPFIWSGSWSHNARNRAGNELVTWATDHNEDCLNIVAHSHGSNVAFIASNDLQFGRMILLSTPYHPSLYEPKNNNYESIFSLRVHLDLVVLGDGGGNNFPDEWGDTVKEKYIGWFNHSSTHHESRWVKEAIPGWLTAGDTCP